MFGFLIKIDSGRCWSCWGGEAGGCGLGGDGAFLRAVGGVAGGGEGARRRTGGGVTSGSGLFDVGGNCVADMLVRTGGAAESSSSSTPVSSSGAVLERT